MADSSALLSTCAGAGATLVAIVGGLLISRYLALEAELLSAEKAVEDLTTKLEIAEHQADESRREWEITAIQNAFSDEANLDDFLKAARNPVGVLPYERITRDLRARGISKRAIRSQADAWLTEARRLVIEFDWTTVPRTDQHELWDDFARKRDIRRNIDPLWQRQYQHICNKRRERGDLALPFDPVSLDPIFPFVSPLSVSSALERSRRDRVEVDRLRAELNAAIEARNAWVRPPGLGSGLSVLALLTVTCVVVPVIFLAPTPATLTYGESVAVVAAFFGGILALFAYLGKLLGPLFRRPNVASPRVSSGGDDDVEGGIRAGLGAE